MGTDSKRRKSVLDLDEPSVHVPAPVRTSPAPQEPEAAPPRTEPAGPILVQSSTPAQPDKTLRMAVPPPTPGRALREPKPQTPPAPPGSTRRGMPRPSTPPPPPRGTAPSLKVTGSLIGHILVENGLLTDQQRDVVLKMQAQSGHAYRFGELAVNSGFVSAADLERALAAQRRYVHGVHEEQSRMVGLPEEVSNLDDFLVEESSVCLKWLDAALRKGASDLYVLGDSPLVMRLQGKLVASKKKVVRADEAKRVLLDMLTDDDQAQLAQRKGLVKAIDMERGRVRATFFYHTAGLSAAFRLIPKSIPSLVSLNLPSTLAKFTTYAQGLVLITGPIGSGKTTTLAALVDIINKERRDHIVILERPIEYAHTNARSLITQREVGRHTKSYVSALRAALREDPDVIVVGDMSDLDTARLTIAAAETGHLVFATLHTDNAVRTINRAIDLFPPDEQNQIRVMLSESLQGIACQRLVPRADQPGLIPVVETLFATPAMRNLVREQKVYQITNAMKMNRSLGNRTFAEHAAELHEAGVISQETRDFIVNEGS